MTLQEIIDKIDQTQTPINPVDRLLEEIHLDGSFGYTLDYDKVYEKESPFKQYPILEWICTDTCVGYHAIFFNGELLAITIQTARRSDTSYNFANKEIFTKAYNYLKENYVSLEYEYNVDYIDGMDKDFGKGLPLSPYNVNLANHIIRNSDSKLLKVAKEQHPMKLNGQDSRHFTHLKVIDENNEIIDLCKDEYIVPFLHRQIKD